jgi:ankyrin repeat protein
VKNTQFWKHLLATTAWLYLSSAAYAQYLPPSIPGGMGGMSPRANLMKSDARAVNEATRAKAAPASKAAAPATNPSNSSKGSVDGAKDYPTAPASAVHRAASEGKTEEIKADLDANPGALTRKDAEGFIPLHLAAAGGHVESVMLLLSSGSDINAQGTRGETALFLAAAEGNSEVVEILLAEGADPNLASKELRTPLHRAAQEGHLAAVRALLKGGADASAKDKQGRTALDLAERYRAGNDANQVISELIKARK